MNRWIKLLLFVGVPTLLLFSFWIVKHRANSRESETRHRQLTQEVNKKLAPLVAIWKQIKTTPVEEIDFDQLASDCPVQADLGLINQEQEHKLRQAVADFWRWSSQTNFEVYRDLRLKTPYVLIQREVDKAHKVMAGENKAANWPTDAEQVLRRIWDDYYRSSRVAEIATGAISISVVKQIHNINNPMFDAIKAELPGLGIFIYPKFVEVHPTPQETMQEHEEILCALVHQYWRHAIDGKTFKGEEAAPVPMNASFYWSPELQKWLPWTVAAALANPKVLIPF